MNKCLPLQLALILATGISEGKEKEAGKARDKNPFTFTGNFKCNSSEVTTAYGKKFTILADGVDVCSWEYAAQEGFSRKHTEQLITKQMRHNRQPFQV